MENVIKTPADQYRLMVLACVHDLIAALPVDAAEALCESYPAIAAYRNAALEYFLENDIDHTRAWDEISAHCALKFPAWPVQALPRLGLGGLHARLLLSLAMVEEDASLAVLFESEPVALTMGGLIARWRNVQGMDLPELVRSALYDLVECGLVLAQEKLGARSDRAFAIADPAADILSGLMFRRPDMQFVDHMHLPDPALWITPRADCAIPAAVGEQLAADPSVIRLIRGASRNGRKTFAQMAAKAAGLNLIHMVQEKMLAPETARLARSLAALSHAALLIEIHVEPGDMARLPEPAFTDTIPVLAICSDRTSVETTGCGTLHSIRLPMPALEARCQLWERAGVDKKAALRHAADWILTSGNIQRAAAAIRVRPDKKDGRGAVRMALRDLRDARLDTLANAVDPDIAPTRLYLDRDGEEEIDTLVLRCRHREKMAVNQGGCGVRAIFSGASGTGKTLAARHIAWQLGKDLYRIDLSATVNKYIGETEKALERALSAAEELDIVLLLDEGDALMARRTDVGSSNDRYANLETNFLLQRIENFNGILIVTTNDAERIDQAFSRRMDASIILRPPDQVRREAILASHLYEGAAVSKSLVRDIACRCTITGGQIRNIALHARLLSLEGDRAICDADLRLAVEREYRKIGAPCPLRSEGAQTRKLSAVR